MTDNITFDDVLDELMFEESKPDYKLLLQWIERYPRFEKELSEYFATWAVQSEMPKTVEIDREKIVRKGVAHAMEILRKQGRILEDKEIEAPLQPLDQLVLAAVYFFHGQGHDVDITGKVSEMAGKRVLLASVLGALERLESRYLISGRDAQSERYFAITIAGERALALARATSSVLEDALGDFA